MSKQYYALKIHASMVDQMEESLGIVEGLSGLYRADIVPEKSGKKRTGNFLLTAVFEDYAANELTKVITPFYPDAQIQEYVDDNFNYQDFTTILGPEA